MIGRKRVAAILFVLNAIFATTVLDAGAEEKVSCKSLDTREFGLVSDGNISESWSEAQLMAKYGPPCHTVEMGAVYVEKVRGRIVEVEARTLQKEEVKSGATAIKKQLIYSGDDSGKTSVFTILDGLVIKKERVN